MTITAATHSRRGTCVQHKSKHGIRESSHDEQVDLHVLVGEWELLFKKAGTALSRLTSQRRRQPRFAGGLPASLTMNLHSTLLLASSFLPLRLNLGSNQPNSAL